MRRTLIAALLALGMVISISAPASAYSLTGCDWNRRIIDVYVGDVPSGKWANGLGTAISQYTSRTDVTLLSRTQSGPSFKAEAKIYGNTGWNGQATWFCILGSTQNSTVKVNRSASEMANGSQARVALTWQHEVGHALGLAHVTPVARVMHGGGTGKAWNAGVRTLTSDEIAGINHLY